MKRTVKFYRMNENEVMKRLGFRPTKNSGAGWIEKEDGENEVAICQLKSTDAQSIQISQKDLRVLEYHAAVSHKVPVFAIQFLNTGEVWMMVRPDDLVLNKKDFSDIFVEKEEKKVDTEQKKEYNVREAKENKKAREKYRKQMKEEQKEKEKEIKERRKMVNRWKKSSNREG